MDRRQVVRFVEIGADDLPVEIAVRRQVHHALPVVETVALQALREWCKPFLERRDVVVHAPEYERAPCLAAQFRKVNLAAWAAALEIIRVLPMNQRDRKSVV